MDAAPRPSQSPSRLVGRERELTILRERLAAAIAGRGSLVLIGGEAGVGKTALAGRLAREAVDAGAHVSSGHCYDRMETPPYGPWMELAQGLSSLLPPTEVLLPRIGTAMTQASLFAQARDVLAAASAERPLVLVLEDMHWADTASLELLRFLARTLSSLPLLLIVTYRDEELDRHHPLAALIPLLVREAPMERLDLRPLDADAACTLVRAVYDFPADEAARLAAFLIERTEGNALCMTELLRSLAEQQLLYYDGMRWHIGAIAQAAVPRLLKQITNARLARLGNEGAALLSIAAVIGQEVPLAVWEVAAQMDEETLVTLVERAEAAHLVSAWTSGDGIRFTHALIRRVLYESIPAPRRRRVHQRVGETLAARSAPDSDAVAYHFQQAHDERAVMWLMRAGQHAEARLAHRTASERYERALTLLDVHIGDAADRGWLHLRVAFLRRYDDPGVALTHVARAMEIAREGEDPRLAAYARLMNSYMLVLQRRHGAAVGEAEVGAAALAALPPGDDAQRARAAPFAAFLHEGTPVVWMAVTGRLAAARAAGERLLIGVPIPPATRDEASRTAVVWAALAYVYTLQGELARAWTANDAARVAYEIVEQHRLFTPPIREGFAREMFACVADDLAAREALVVEAEQILRRTTGTELPGEVSYGCYTRLPLMIVEGRWLQAHVLAEGLKAAYTTDSVIAPCNHALGMIARSQGALERAWQLVHEILPDGAATPPGNMNLSFALPTQRLAIELALDSGDMRAARDWLDAYDHWLDWSGAKLGRASGQVLWGRYYRLAGMMMQSETAGRSALEQAMSPHQPLALLAAHRLLAELATGAGRFAEAERYISEALALAGACRAPYERALTLLSSAELAIAHGDPAAAAASLDAVRVLCEPLDARPALERVAALEPLLAHGEQRPAYPKGITAREAQVLRLVAAGLTNAQVAERLFISARTVNGHLTAIYTKLNIPSRAAAIRFAIEHDLR
jgi:DNA-binding CsgD family transcriptional regulator/DNA polymerase III delta prime subunit